MSVAVKICGITRAADARAALDCGAAAIGLVFYPPSPRAIDPAAAAAIVRQLPPLALAVGLFVDQDERSVRRVLSRVPLNMLQFHGAEDDGFCASFGLPYIKAVRMRGPDDATRAGELWPGARALLLDSPGQGGSGRGFNWDWVPPPDARRMPVVLAGGLTAGNIDQALARARPDAVDLSSGVERAPGIKDAQLMRAFMQKVRGW